MIFRSKSIIISFISNKSESTQSKERRAKVFATKIIAAYLFSTLCTFWIFFVSNTGINSLRDIPNAIILINAIVPVQTGYFYTAVIFEHDDKATIIEGHVETAAFGSSLGHLVCC